MAIFQGIWLGWQAPSPTPAWGGGCLLWAGDGERRKGRKGVRVGKKEAWRTILHGGGVEQPCCTSMPQGCPRGVWSSSRSHTCQQPWTQCLPQRPFHRGGWLCWTLRFRWYPAELLLHPSFQWGRWDGLCAAHRHTVLWTAELCVFV